MLSDSDRRVAVQALRHADLRVLLMCLFQITGDETWLQAPYLPERDVRLVADPSAGLPPEVQEQIRAAALDVLDRAASPAVPIPDEALFQRMMSVCLGEPVPAEYAPMMRSEMSFVSEDPSWAGAPPRDVPSVVIVGAGLSGIAIGAQLTRLGIPYTVLEKNDEVGGTWWENTYPGAGVDTPNHAYSYSHGNRYHWSRFFALRDEIQDYIVRCADEFGVVRHVRFGRTVVGATWNAAAGQWQITARTRDGATERLQADFLVTAVGVLNTPKIPPLPGLDTFPGRAFHSARWPDGLDLAAADVAVVGTGATAMQIVPQLAGRTRSLAVYQRSPQWVRPVDGYKSEMPAGVQFLMSAMPFYYEWFRFTMFWRYGDGLLKTLYKDPDWPHPERSVNRRNDLHREELTAFIRSELDGRPELQDRCTPDYPPFGKRILIDNGWYRALREPGVELVTDPLSHLDGADLVTADGTHRHTDVLVFATGFDVTRLAAGLNIRGRDGVDLADVWADDNPTAYLGILVPGFPNMFSLLGPNSALGHGGSTIFQSECQARYIAGCIIETVQRGMRSIEVRQEVHDAYVAALDAEHAKLIWTHPGMSNWYRNAAGRVIAIMPWRLVDFWHMTRRPRFEEFVFGGRSAVPAAAAD